MHFHEFSDLDFKQGSFLQELSEWNVKLVSGTGAAPCFSAYLMKFLGVHQPVKEELKGDFKK